MTAADYLAGASGVFSLIAVVVSIGVARRQNIIARQDQLFPFVAEIVNRFNEPSFKVLLERVRGLPRQVSEPYHFLDPSKWEEIRPLSAYFNEIGLLISRRAIDAELVAALMGGSLAESWSILAPYVYARRSQRGGDDNYYAFFEHAAAEIARLQPRGLQLKLSLQRLPPS